MIPIYKPFIKNYTNSAINSINKDWISNHGIYVKLASDNLKKFLTMKYCILMNNGTAATHCLFLALKYRYPDISKIYVPNNVFIAVWNCALMEYPKNILEVMKMNPNTLNIDVSEEYILSLDKNSVVFIVHNLGYIVNVMRLKKLRPDLIFIEDNCEGFTGKYNNQYSGTQSLCSSLSFYANKIITSGEGGAFLTNDKSIYNYILKLHSHGMTEERYIHNTIAYNYRMTNIQAAFLYEQLIDMEYILKKKQNVFDFYDILFKNNMNNKKIIKITDEVNTTHSNWMYSIIIPKLDYKKFEIYMLKSNIEIRPFFYDIRKHEHLKNIKINYNELEITKHGVILPSYPMITNDEQKYISYIVNNFINLNL